MSRVLVSGATGFIAAHAIERLLARGHEVTGTVRDPGDTARLSFLTGMAGAERLRLVAADLTEADPFTAHADVDAVLHMASPYVVDAADPQRDLVDPAVNGTLAMLRAARARPRVRRVVLTSSMAAVTDEPDGRTLTEADWNTRSSLRRNPYYFSKAEAERAAWAFMEAERPGFDLVVINPFLVIGPAHSRVVNTSNRIFVDMLAGAYPAILALDWGLVDVRDVAEAHIAAMERPGAQGRYLCASGQMTMAEVAGVMRAAGFSGRLPRLNLSGPVGTALMKLVSRTQPQGVGSYLRTHLGRHPRFDTSKLRRDLGIVLRPPAESVRDTLADLVRWGHIAAPAAHAP
jgi:dihydroflavonol-4-reductase